MYVSMAVNLDCKSLSLSSIRGHISLMGCKFFCTAGGADADGQKDYCIGTGRLIIGELV